MKTTVLISTIIINLFISCTEKSNEAVAEMKMSKVAHSSSYNDSYAEAVDTAVAAADMSVSMPNKLAGDAEEIETKIIKSGNLRFQSDYLEQTYSKIQGAVKKYNALIKNDSQSNNDYQFSRTINIRIPNQYFDAFIADISKGVTYFDIKEISSQDVTEEYIDVASRIKTKKVLEQRYLELLKKANKVSEMLEIEGQLSEIREEIESKEGRLKYLQNKVSLSTIDLTFYKPVAQGRKATVSYGGRIGNAIISGFNSISNFFIALLGIWPVIVTLGVLFVLIRKRFKRKNKNDVNEK